MKLSTVLFTIALASLVSGTTLAEVVRQGEIVRLSGRTYAITFSAANGSILAVTQPGKTGSIFRSGEQGPWHVRFRDGTQVVAAEFSAGSAERAFKCDVESAANALRMTFESRQVAVTITVTGRADGVDFVGQLTPREKAVLDFALPARLRFDPGQLERLVWPLNGNSSVGAAFKPAFFKVQPQDNPSRWEPRVAGPGGYVALYGGPLDQRADQDPSTTLRVTPQGREWFSAELAVRVEGAQAVVNRPPTRAQADLVLADSPNGPYFSASHLGGAGFLWRIGGGVGEEEQRNVADMVVAALDRLATSLPPGRGKLGLVALNRGPERGGWTAVSVREWRDRLRNCQSVRSSKVQLAELTSALEMMKALRAVDFFAILNPYGEWTPVVEDGGMRSVVEAVGRYVREGGNWFEVGGYPFFYEMRPARYLSCGTSYPAGFADFFHLDTQAGAASVYRVQPQKWQPWEGAKNKEAIFVPGRLECGGDDQGGYCDRSFGTFVAPGETFRSPVVRLTLGNSAAQGLRAYCEANEIRRRLADKMRPEVLERFRKAVLVYYAGNCQEKLANLEQLPVPTLIHFADYLKGGFDKQYPDHLPPSPSFGTEREFRAFFDRCRELGHLVMPYTNPTWWCDHPKGPTFEREGEAPLLKTLDGKLSYERYAQNDGFTVCHWHPAVQEANRKTVRQFSEDYPVDVLFQDQCGARGWQYDANPASSTPFAYSDGLVSMVAEDCKAKPLSTESGWDRVVNYEVQLCGMSWSLVPTEGGPSWRNLMKYEFPPETWEVFPLAQYIAHDKTAMLYHDLGQFVTNREVLAWTLGLGFCMSYRVGATSLRSDAPKEWLRWLDRIQKSICARYVGQPVLTFEHDRGLTPRVEDDGSLRATYGPVKVVANLGPKPRTEAGHELPPYGFHATAPGVVAANVKSLAGNDSGEEGVSFVVEGNAGKAEVWVYAPAQQEVAVETPAGMTGEVSVAFEGAPPTTAKAARGFLSLRLPARSEKPRTEPPPSLADKAPRDWPGEKAAIGVLEFDGISPTWTRITPEDWWKALTQSRIAREFGAPIKRVTRVEELTAALDDGPRKWLALVNPYGEGFPATALGKWREMLDRIRHYVNNGGWWWETAGASLYYAFSPAGKGWQTENIGPAGMSYLGLRMEGGDVEAPAEPLKATPEGRKWLGDNLSARVDSAQSIVNRALPHGNDDPGHVTLVAGERQGFIGGYRLEGWGWFWRIGGFWPNQEVALPAVVAAMEHLYTHPPLPVKAGGVKYLWHAVVRRG